MNTYVIIFQCSNGYEGIEYIDAANRIAAFEVFNGLGYEDVINADCVRVIEEGSQDK